MSKEPENTQFKTPVWTPELLQQRRKRAAIMAVALLVFVGLFFWVTLVKLGVNVTNRPL
jgi:hypothetical protein